MFVLREIFEDGSESNRYIGDHYSIYSKFKNKKNFDNCFKDVYGELNEGADTPSPNIYAFIQIWGLSSDDDNIVPLYVKSKNYIVTENGNTYDNISESPRFH